MAGPKFFIYGGSRWREIDTSNGRVTGWGGVQFVSVHRGRLQVARRSSVLRGLRSLASSNPTTVHDGLPLSQIRHDAIEEKKEKGLQCNQQYHCCCHQHQISSNLNNTFNNLLKVTTNTAAIQCTLTNSIPSKEVNIETNFNSIKSKGSDPVVLEYPKSKSKKEIKRLIVKRKRSLSDNENRKIRKTHSISSEDTNDRSLERKRKEKSKIVEKIKSNLVKSTKRKHSTSESDSIREAPKKITKPSKINEKKAENARKHESPNKHLNVLRRSARFKSSSEDDNIQATSSPKVSKNAKDIERPIKKILRSSGKIITSDEEIIEVSPSIISKKLKSKLKINSPDKNKSHTKTVKNSNVLEKSRNIEGKENEPNREFTRKIFNFSIDSDSDSEPQERTQIVTKAQMHVSRNVSTDDSYVPEAYHKKRPTLITGLKTRKNKPRKLSTSDDSVRLNTIKIKDLGSNEPVKELLIEEVDVMLLRTFIEHDEANVFNVNLERFDSDDVYKSTIFYKLNPLVNVVRSREIAKLLSEKNSESNRISFEDFMSTLGLRSVLDTSSQASSKYKMRSRQKPERKLSSEDKENKHNQTKNKVFKSNVFSERIKKNYQKKNKSELSGEIKKPQSGLSEVKRSENGKLSEVKRSKEGELVNVSSESDFEKSKKQSQERPKRPKPVIAVKRGLTKPKKGIREYSRAEDEAIVLWVRGAGRARRVKGNQLWRELQPVHHQTTGLFRSWHSLRNRYLRYLLPALGNLSLSPHEASRLRAEAAAGEIKSRKMQHQNSMLVEPRVKSAWSRRPRPQPPSPPRSPSKSPSRSPIRKFSPPILQSNSSDSDTDTSTEIPVRRESLRSSNVKSAKNERTRTLRSSTVTSTPTTQITQTDTHVPTYSELTKKYASKHDDSDTVTDRRTRQTDKPKTRRLYNPKNDI